MPQRRDARRTDRGAGLRIGRRTFVASTAGLVAAAACRSGCNDSKHDEPAPEHAVFIAALRERFASLEIPDEVYARFAADEARHQPLEPRLTRSVARRFVMSTTLPTSSAAPAYVAYYDPYVTVCYNPLRDAAPA